MRAEQPVRTGYVERDGVCLGFEVFGEGDRTVLLLPTWTIIHSRFWKMQVAYLARYYRVITYDGPGNGRSDRNTDPTRYAVEAYAADARCVLESCGVDSAVVVGLSRGAAYGVGIALAHPELVTGLVLIGPALPLAPQSPERAGIARSFDKPYPENPRGWEKYNLRYWHDQYDDFVRFFFDQVFAESHSTKPWEDALGWALETGPDILEAEAGGSALTAIGAEALAELTCPVLVIHGSDDRIIPHAVGEEAARITGGNLVTLHGSGHMPNVRDPVRVNLAIRGFVESGPR